MPDVICMPVYYTYCIPYTVLYVYIYNEQFPNAHTQKTPAETTEEREILCVVVVKYEGEKSVTASYAK